MKYFNQYIKEKLNVKNINLDIDQSLSKLKKNLINEENMINTNSFINLLIGLHNQNYKKLILSIDNVYCSLVDQNQKFDVTVFRKSKFICMKINRCQYDECNIHELFEYLSNISLIYFDDNNSYIIFNTAKNETIKDIDSINLVKKNLNTIVLQIKTY